MSDADSRNDVQLLVATPTEPEAFGVFYRRHERTVLLYLLRRTGSAELAADLTAEVFAATLQACQRRRAAFPAIPLAWLFGIAHHKLADSYARGRVEDRARRRLGMEPVLLGQEDLRLLGLADQDDRAINLISALPPDQRVAVQARVLEDRAYPDIASELRCSESVVRKRVSRGLATLRTQLQEST
jgi:RNA polymerase sigma factor (sigma-70 family)